MPFQGNGTYSPPSPAFPAVTNDVISSEYFNQIIEDIAAALSICLTADGQQPIVANQNYAGFKITNLANGSANSDSVTYGQVFNSPAFNSPTAVASPPTGDSSQLLATTSWVVSLSLSTALPGQAGNATAFISTNGVAASWQYLFTDPWVFYAIANSLRANAFSQ